MQQPLSDYSFGFVFANIHILWYERDAGWQESMKK